MFDFIYNIANDIYYGYLSIKCSNKYCKRVFKVSRNNYDGSEYCCNTGCAFEAYNNK